MSYSERFVRAEAMYLSGLSIKRAAEESSLTFCELRKHLLSRGLVRPMSEAFTAANDPDEATIRERAAEIQAGWTEEERRRRWVGGAGAAAVVHRKFATFRLVVARRKVA